MDLLSLSIKYFNSSGYIISENYMCVYTKHNELALKIISYYKSSVGSKVIQNMKINHLP